MWDTEHFQAYPCNKCRNQIHRAETFVYCNRLIRVVHVDVYSLRKGADDMVIRSLIDHGTGFKHKFDFIDFFM